MKTITNNTLDALCSFLDAHDNFVFLDTSKPCTQNRSSMLFINPVERLQYHEGEDEIQFLKKIQGLQRQKKYLAGWFSYEFGYLFEPGLKALLCRDADRGVLLADLGVFRDCYRFDHGSGETDFPRGEEQEQGEAAFSISNLRFSQTREQYLEAINRILEYIRAGDTYQVNYTLKLLFDFSGSAEKLYTVLRRNQSVGYGAYIRRREERVMSFSPELFFWKKGGEVMVRPMKGTLKRGRTPEEDGENRLFLQTDIKNRSENVMIVDLLRNDLGRLMHTLGNGEVRVDSLFDVETYETLLQMTSTITGSTEPDRLAELPLYDFFKTIFPCGSVTGAPKIRTMEIINELESGRRGVYTGAIGYMAPDGEAVFNVPIRTVFLKGGQGEMGIGSGIVHDSEPDQEWQECLLKGRFLTAPRRPFALIETLLWTTEGGYLLVEEHLRRLEASAAYFLFSCERQALIAAISRAEDDFGQAPMRVRLLLEKDGGFTIEAEKCPQPQILRLPSAPDGNAVDLPLVAFSEVVMDSGSCWLYHKTTNREVYRAATAEARSRGLFDLLFTNEKGQVTEGSISNLFVCKEGRYLTPPVTDGLLPGVMRRFLIDSCPLPVEERSLVAADLFSADAVFLCNAVRGVVQVRLCEGGEPAELIAPVA